MYRHSHLCTDHNIEVNLHEPCEKDLRISYLEQYELNNMYVHGAHDYQNNRQHSKNNLKQITDKYGFYWDQRGKLLKIRDKYKKKDIQENKRGRNKQNKKKIQIYIQKQREKQREKQRKPYISPLKIQEQNTSIKHEIKSIDQRISKIVNKYHQPLKNISKSNISQIEQDYCQCQRKYQMPNKKQHQKISFRVQTEQNFKEIPYFRAGFVQPYKQPIERSKSTNYLTKNHKYVYNNEQRGSPINNNYNTQDYSKEKYYSRTLSKKKDKKISEQVQSPSQKQIDNKIDRITQKIKQFQRQKQKLEIDFKKFQYKQRPKTPQKITQEKKCPRLRIQVQERVSSYYQQQSSSQIQKAHNPQNKVRVIEDYKNFFNQQFSTIVQTQKKKKQRVTQNLSLNKKENKRKVVNKGLLWKLCRQIELDQQFRNAKLWFQSNQDPHKWGIMADKLSIDGMTLKYKQLVQIFSCQPEEHNPFFSHKTSHQNYSSLIAKFKQYQGHWKGQIQNNFTREQLELEDFSSKQLDVEQKGYVKVEDLVRYINMRTKNFYRSRDLLLIFQRFAGKQKKQVHFSRIQQVLTY